jgi:hypothetical protein
MGKPNDQITNSNLRPILLTDDEKSGAVSGY